MCIAKTASYSLGFSVDSMIFHRATSRKLRSCFKLHEQSNSRLAADSSCTVVDGLCHQVHVMMVRVTPRKVDAMRIQKSRQGTFTRGACIFGQRELRNNICLSPGRLKLLAAVAVACGTAGQSFIASRRVAPQSS